MNLRPLLAVLALLGCAREPAPTTPAGVPLAPGHWPQFRGPNRDGVSGEKGLLKEWPAGGPKLLWKATGFGEGVSPVSVAGGLIFILGYRDGKEFVSAYDGDGTLVWSRSIAPSEKEYPGMRFLGQRAPTVDDDRLYVTTASGSLICLRSANGTLLWQKEFGRDFGGRSGGWRFAERPLVDGTLLICAPGGLRGTLVALNKRTGEPVWQSTELKDPISYAPVIAAEIAGIRQYIVFTRESVAGVGARNGRLLWRAERRGATVVVPTPVQKDDLVFVSSGHGIGCTAFRVTLADGRFQVRQLYAGRQLENYHDGMILLGDHLYGTDRGSLKCVDPGTGTVLWQERCVGQGSVAYADGRLIVRGDSGPVAMVEAVPEGYREKGRLDLPSRSRELGFSYPVLAGGRLYLRDIDTLLCYDLRGPDFKEAPPVWNIAGKVPPRPPDLEPLPVRPAAGKQSDAVFVPTPQDIVERMLDLARVTNEDVVVDLGSGDGRIAITAFRRHGCRAIGFEIDPKLVEHSRAEIRKGRLEKWVKIEDKDLFTADLSDASVVTLYLGAPNNAKLLPQLMKLKPGSRIVSHMHLLGAAGPKPDRELKVVSQEDQVEHTIYLWTAPLGKGQK